MWLIKWLYSLLWCIGAPGLLVWLGYKGLRQPEYLRGWGQRLGRQLPKESCNIWLHAASLGEVNTAEPLLRELIKNHRKLLVTTLTPAGKLALTNIDNVVIQHSYLPIDIPWVINAFLTVLKPKVLIIIEAELWPNLLHCCIKKQVKIVLINARMSQSSYASWRYFTGLLPLTKFALVLAKSKEDASRYCKLGLPLDKVKVFTNLKCTLKFCSKVKQQGVALRAKLPWQFIIIAGSTYAIEEKMLLEVYTWLRKKYSNVGLILAPRHIERSDKVSSLAQQYGIMLQRFSHGVENITTEYHGLLVDEFGKLLTLYACADMAFVGGSFAPKVGGHNLVEPIIYGLPVVVGPYIDNIKEVADLLITQHLLTMAYNLDDVKRFLLNLLDNPTILKNKQSQALAWGLQHNYKDELMQIITAYC